jgi:hypothetical protein
MVIGRRVGLKSRQGAYDQVERSDPCDNRKVKFVAVNRAPIIDCFACDNNAIKVMYTNASRHYQSQGLSQVLVVVFDA